MKRFLKLIPILLASVCASLSTLRAQTSTSDCIGAIPVCVPIYTQNNAPAGSGNTQDLDATNQDCLSSGEHKTSWYIINIVTSGTLAFNITPVDLNDDYDFAVWNVTPSGCGQNPCDIVHTAPPVRCNYSGTSGITGLSAAGAGPSIGAGGTPFSTVINAVAGESYMILVDNFIQSQNGYTLDFTPSTVSITDTAKPFFRNVTTACGFGTDELIVSMSEPITCNSLSSNGSEFYLTDAAGTPVNYTVTASSSNNCLSGGNFSNVVNLHLSGILPAGNYVLHVAKGLDGNTLSDNCGNLQDTTSSKAFTIQPDPSPLSIVSLDTPACIKTIIRLARPIRCNTVALDGSDFKITGPDGTAKVISATPLSCQTVSAGCQGTVDLTDTISLEFDKSLLLPGTYTLSVVNGTDGNSIIDTCGSAIAPYNFIVSDGGYVFVSNNNPLIVCNPDYIVLSASTPIPQAVHPGYNWSGSFLSDSTIQFPTAYIAASTSYTVRVMDTFECYRRAKLDIIVPIRHPKILNHDTAICIGDYTELLAGGGVDYVWFPSTGLSCTNCSNPNASLTVNTIYYVAIFDQYGCSDTLSTTILVNPLPVVTINDGRDTTIIYSESVPLYALSPKGKFYTWEPVTGLNNANIPNPIATPPITTNYTVYVTDLNQCKNTASIDVTVRRDIPVAVPSGFTPNSDGRNDLFRVANLTFQKIEEFRIFNRWGQEVYSSHDNSGWDGTYGGKMQDADVYKYLIRVAYPDGTVRNFKGDVTLIR